MSALNKLYRPSLALLTDLYQLTMAYGYWKNGLADHQAVFHLFFRKNPFGGGYAVAAGLEAAADLIERTRFDDDDITYLSTLTGNDGKPLFEDAFLEYLRTTPLQLDVDAMPEGTIAFPHAPLLRLRGSLIAGQLLETPLLTIINFQTLIATKSARICQAAQGEPVLEFGLRRAQGIDGGLSAARAAYIGGCSATSNVLAGRLFDIPVKGTHAHAWVMTFPTEPESFSAYAKAMPNNCVFLVDTYDTLEGVKNAVEVGLKLRESGHEMVGIRLDSGDLAALSIEARKILDDGGFPTAGIVASNDLDEFRITALKERGATITVWGVGTRLSTAYDQPALGGVYKLAAIKAPDGPWEYRIKLSENPIKISNPGMLQVRRYFDLSGQPMADLMYNELEPPTESATLISLANTEDKTEFPVGTPHQDLLTPIFRDGKRIWKAPTLHAVRDHALKQLSMLPAKYRTLTDAEAYPLGLEADLHEKKLNLLAAARSGAVS